MEKHGWAVIATGLCSPIWMSEFKQVKERAGTHEYRYTPSAFSRQNPCKANASQ